MAAFGVSIPDDLAAEIDAHAETWRSNRSQTFVRIFLEWKELRAIESRPVRRLPGFIPNEAIEAMRAKQPAVAGASRPERDESFHMGTGPGDDLGEAA